MTEAGMVNHQEIDREAELDELQRHVERALDRARRGGATAAEASAQSSLGLAVTVRLGEVETLEHMPDRSIGITVYRGRRQGHATCADLEPQSIDTCVDRALEMFRSVVPTVRDDVILIAIRVVGSKPATKAANQAFESPSQQVSSRSMASVSK